METEYAVKLQEVEDRSKRNEGRIKKLEENQTALNQLALSVKELATDQANMKKDITEIKADVKSLSSAPAGRWDALVKAVVTAIVAGLVGYALALAGLGV